MNDSGYNGSEKRTYIRISYAVGNRPRLKIGQIDVDIMDLSESGIRIVKNDGLTLDKTIHGIIALLCGKSVAIDADVVWDKNGETGLLLTHLIPSDIMEKEKQHVILKQMT